MPDSDGRGHDATQIDSSIDHFNIEKREDLHDRVIPEVIALMRRRHASR